MSAFFGLGEVSLSEADVARAEAAVENVDVIDVWAFLLSPDAVAFGGLCVTAAAANNSRAAA